MQITDLHDALPGLAELIAAAMENPHQGYCMACITKVKSDALAIMQPCSICKNDHSVFGLIALLGLYKAVVDGKLDMDKIGGNPSEQSLASMD